MKSRSVYLLAIAMFALGGCSSGKLTLVRNGESAYSIVIPADATPMERKSAEEFSRLLALSSSVALPIVADTAAESPREIVIGNTNRTPAAEGLDDDGFLIRTDQKRLYIAGGADKGTLYGVYTFFDQYLGYRCYSPTVFKYPELASVSIPRIEDLQNPVNAYRNVHYAVAMDPFYADWHKLDHMSPDWGKGMFVHTFSKLVPASEYFDEHPEYFALVDGKRLSKQADPHLPPQLCLSNPDVLKVVVENLGKMMEANPEAHYWSVSQSDTYPDQGFNCTCPECAALDSASGSPSGSLITFVNKVAEHFPDKTISTLAYRYSRKAPTAVKPADNVNIMLCNIECLRHMPIELDPTSESFCKDFEEWGQIANNILMWDYVIQFTNLMAPFPNLRTLQPNIQYFVRNGVTAHFQLGNISRGGEWSELRPYLIARLLWNPDVDIEAEMTDFLEGYYEDAAPCMAEYINLMHDELEVSGLPLAIYGHPYDHFEKGFMRPEVVERYDSLFDRAQEAAASKPDVLERVKVARLPLEFSLFEIAIKRGTDESRVFEQVDGKWQVRPEVMARLESFRELCNKSSVQHMSEGWTSPDEYYDKTKNQLLSIVAQ